MRAYLVRSDASSVDMGCPMTVTSAPIALPRVDSLPEGGIQVVGVPMRLALVGAGAIADSHLESIRATPGLELRLVVDRHAKRAEALAARCGAVASTVIGDVASSEIDAVVICTSPESHASLALEAITAGKPVMVEKPVALDLRSADEILAAAAKAKVPLLVGQTARFQPAHLELGAALHSGAIGAARIAEISWYAGHVWPGGWRAWQLDPERSGGHLLHNGIHALDLLVWLFDDVPVRVQARGIPTWACGMTTPDTFQIIVEFASSALAVVTLSYGLRQRGVMSRRVVVLGEEGSLCVDSDDEQTVMGRRGVVLAGVEDAMNNQYEHWRNVLVGTETPRTSPEQIRGALAAALASQLSADTGRVCEVEAS